MKIKIILVVFLVVIISTTLFFYYQYYYEQTLMLSEIVDTSDNPKLSIVTNLFDFDTGLTRHDIHRLESSKEYWIKRINEVEQISDSTIKQIENEKLIAEMLEDPTMKKLVKGIVSRGFEFVLSILYIII